MTKPIKFEPDLWLGNRDLRACSPAARGFWIDLMCICHASAGYLHVNGKPVDDTQLARMVGEPVKSVRAWLKELGEAGIYSVNDRGLHSSKMVKEFAFVEKAAKDGARGVAVKKNKQSALKLRILDQSLILNEAIKARKAAEEEPQASAPIRAEAPQRVAPKAKALPWYKSPAGWARKGAEQSVSLVPDEDIEDFKARVAGRIPPGPHLEELTKYHRDAILAKVEQYAAKPGEEPRTR